SRAERGHTVRALALSLLLCLSCGARQANAPAPPADLPRMFGHAFRADAGDNAGEAVREFLIVMRAASRSDGDPWQLAALEASLDALATRAMPSLGDAARDAALANRTREAGTIGRELARAAG